MQLWRPLLFALLLTALTAHGESVLEGGHTKLRLKLADIPSDNLFADTLGSPAFDQGGDLRLRFKLQRGQWDLNADYQLIVQAGDSLSLLRVAS